MNKIIIPKSYNYIGAFLTFGCNLECSYCINYQREAKPRYKHLSYQAWIDGLNRLITRKDLPITLQGGEPTIHPDFYKIVNGVDKSVPLDLLTNAQFDEVEFMNNVSPSRFKRDAPYASIRVSYHIEQMELTPLIQKVKDMLGNGYSVGVWIVDDPRDSKIVRISQELMRREGIDCRLKELLGYCNGKLYGTYKYPHAMNGMPKKCLCKPSELLIAPDGGLHRCHYELYHNKKAYQHVLNSHVKVIDGFKECRSMGLCNSCDIKLKNDRFQVGGHCSVEIKEMCG